MKQWRGRLYLRSLVPSSSSSSSSSSFRSAFVSPGYSSRFRRVPDKQFLCRYRSITSWFFEAFAFADRKEFENRRERENSQRVKRRVIKPRNKEASCTVGPANRKKPLREKKILLLLHLLLLLLYRFLIIFSVRRDEKVLIPSDCDPTRYPENRDNSNEMFKRTTMPGIKRYAILERFSWMCPIGDVVWRDDVRDTVSEICNNCKRGKNKRERDYRKTERSARSKIEGSFSSSNLDIYYSVIR